jgi:Uma2 family endonuclease
MSLASNIKLTEQAYLNGERHAKTKHEYVNGDAYAMAGSSEDHNIISGNFFAEIRQKLKGKPCQAFIADMKIKAGTNFFYPDVMVVCTQDDADTKYVKHAPTIIVEVLSTGTRKNDITLKKLAYLNLPSLQEYVLIEQDKCEIEVFRRNKSWTSTYYVLGDTINFESLDIIITVEEIYDNIKNDDIDLFLKHQKN